VSASPAVRFTSQNSSPFEFASAPLTNVWPSGNCWALAMTRLPAAWAKVVRWTVASNW
jgi:hypothetical protein